MIVDLSPRTFPEPAHVVKRIERYLRVHGLMSIKQRKRAFELHLRVALLHSCSIVFYFAFFFPALRLLFEVGYR